jgi:hypothetical protein
MPISFDLDHITGPFRSIGRFQLTPIAYIFQRLGKWLKDRVKKADRLEEASRGIPVVWIDGDAVQSWLDPMQMGALSPNGSPPGFWDQMHAAAAAFWAGLKRMPEAIANESIVPRLLARTKDALKAVLDSVIRFEHPTAETFDPRLRTAGDLFGEAALAFRALNSSKLQVITFLFFEVAPAYSLLTAGGESNKQTGVDPKSTTDSLDSISRNLLAALKLLPDLPDLISRLWESAVAGIKSMVIEALAAREQKVQDLRRSVIDVFYVRMRDLIQTSLSFTNAATYILTAQVSFWTDFVHIYGLRLLMDVRKFGDGLIGFVFDVAVWITEKLPTGLDKYLRFNLTPYIMAMVGGPAGFVLSKIASPPTFTLLDLISLKARGLLLTWIGEAMSVAALGLPFTYGIEKRLIRLGRVVNAALTAPDEKDEKLKETAWPMTLPDFPSIYDDWAKASGGADLQQKLKDFQTQGPAAISAIFGAAADAARQAGGRFDDLAAAAARGGSTQEYRSISDRAAGLAERAFGADEKDLRDQIAGEKKNKVAASFERWFAVGGFYLLGQFLERYMGGMLDHFREQEATGDELTAHITKSSPHILAKRAVLGRALMQRLTIDARGRVLDKTLVQEIAGKFRSAVSEAYDAGQKGLLAAATAGAT